MRTEEPTDAKAAARAMWALGDYHRFATQLVWEVGPVVVEAAGIGPGLRVLDVAAGTGNVAVRAAEAGADVVASDLTPENLAAGRAARRGARDRARVGRGRRRGAAVRRRRLRRGHVRVRRHVRPGPPRRGARAACACAAPAGRSRWRASCPDGLAGDFFATLGRHAPPPGGRAAAAVGQPRSTCASCSAMRSPSCAASAGATSSASRAGRTPTPPSSRRPSGR